MSEARVRVCYVLSYFHPFESGAERQALAQGLELVRRGHEVRVVTRFVPGHPGEAEVGGIQVHRWIRTSQRGPLFALSFIRGVIRSLRQLRPHYDVIHTHQALWEAISVGLGRDLLRGAPVLVQPAASGPFGEAAELRRTRGSALLRRLVLRNRHFAAISADIAREWEALGVPPRHIERTASGVDAEHFRPPAHGEDFEQSLPPRPRVVFTGRLHPQKNIDLLLEIWPEVVRQTGASLILVGWGPERQRLMEKAVALGIEPKVAFTGPMDDPADVLRSADAFVLPSVAEGMSNSLLEAMATGLPCLASDIGGNIDLLGGGTGLLLPPDDRTAWTEGLSRVLRHAEVARKLGENARRRVESEFALSIVVDRYLSIYRRLIDQG